MENELLENLGRLHTTELGVIRIKKNLSLNVENVIEWCKEKISLSNAEITRKGKNWYITIDNCLSLKICIEKAVNPKTNCFVCMDIKLLLILNRYPNFNN